MKKELEKVYDPKQVEDKTYRFWLEKRYFHAEPNPKKKPYTIVIPPPNITGQLHLGHALDWMQCPQAYYQYRAWQAKKSDQRQPEKEVT